MRWTMTTISISSLLVFGGCIQDLVAQGAELAPDSDTDTSPAPTTGSSIPTTGVDSGAHTVTGDPDSETVSSPGSNSGDTANDPPPTISLFDATPDLVSQAGKAQLDLIASDDVVAVFLSIDGSQPVEYTTNKFPLYFEYLSEKDNKPAIEFTVEVRDAAEQSAVAHTTLAVTLPPTGQEKCVFEDPERGTVVSNISALRYTSNAIVAVGTRTIKGKPKLSAWLLHPETCQLLPGWPKSIADWSNEDGLTDLQSFGKAVDVTTGGDLVVAGNIVVGIDKVQSYIALLKPNGARIWELAGSVGDEVTGVAAGAKRTNDRVFVVGSRRVSDKPISTDGAIWVYHTTDNGEVFVSPPTFLKAPFTPDEFNQDLLNESSEWLHAVLVDPDNGNALAVGERQFQEDDIDTYKRAFTVAIDPAGKVLGTPWTSSGPSLRSDAARSVALCEEQMVAGGWTHEDNDPNAKPHPLIFWLMSDGSSLEFRSEPQIGATELDGIACDRLNRVVGAGTQKGVDSKDAQVFTVSGPFGPRTPYETGSPEDDGAGAVSCDPRGICAWGGYRTDSKSTLRYAVVRALHP